MRGIAAIGHDPQRHSGKKAQQNRRHRQLIGLSGGQGEADRPAGAVHDDRGLGGEPAAGAAQRLTPVPLFGSVSLLQRTRGFLVRPDRGAVEKRHPQFDAVALLRQFQQTLPHAMVAPADEGLRRHPPWPQMRRNAAPFRAVLVPPDDRLDGAAEVLVLGLVGRAARLDQRGHLSPLGVGQNAITSFVCHGPNIWTVIKGYQALDLPSRLRLWRKWPPWTSSKSRWRAAMLDMAALGIVGPMMIRESITPPVMYVSLGTPWPV